MRGASKIVSLVCKKMLCSNLFIIGWQCIIVLFFLVLWNFWTRVVIFLLDLFVYFLCAWVVILNSFNEIYLFT